jgi:hypothetical protein
VGEIASSAPDAPQSGVEVFVARPVADIQDDAADEIRGKAAPKDDDKNGKVLQYKVL